MGDDADLDAMLEAPLATKDIKREKDEENGGNNTKNNGGEGGGSSQEDGRERGSDRERDEKPSKKSLKKKKHRTSRSRSKSRSRSRSRTPKKKSRRRSRSRSGSRSPSPARKRGRSKRSKRSRSRSRSRSPKERKSRSKNRDRSRSRSPIRPGGWQPRWGGGNRGGGAGWGGGGGGGGGGWGSRRSPPRWEGGRGSPPMGRRLPGPERRDVMPFTAKKSPPRGAKEDMTTEERDARTVFIMQIAARTRPRDLEEFFSSVGNVRDVRIITDSKTRRSKGIAYVEFWEVESVALAIGLNGQRLLNAPLIIQPTQAEKNRAANLGSVGGVPGFGFDNNANKGPMKLYVGSLHFNITEDMLRGIFEPFGRIDQILLMKEPDSDRSRGYGFVTFHQAEDAKRAMEQLNGFELAGRPIKVGNVTEHTAAGGGSGRSLDTEELDKTGVDLGTAGRLQLMAKLAEGTGLAIPNQAQQVLNVNQQQQQGQQAAPPIATQCFMLSNMFDPENETEPNWDSDIKDDVIEECSKNGGVLHIYVDKAAKSGNVYVKCPTVASAHAAVNSLHGRWFAGKIITANYVPVSNYHQLFPDAAAQTLPLRPTYKP